MDTVFSILHRMIGPIMLAIGLSILYLLTDGLSAYVSAVKGNYADAYTYREGKPSSFELDKVDGKNVLAMINDGSATICFIETNTGNNNVIYRVEKTSVGWNCTVSDVNYHIVGDKVYSQGQYANPCSIDDVRGAIFKDAEYEVEYEYSEDIDTTKVIFRCLF